MQISGQLLQDLQTLCDLSLKSSGLQGYDVTTRVLNFVNEAIAEGKLVQGTEKLVEGKSDK